MHRRTAVLACRSPCITQPLLGRVCRRLKHVSSPRDRPTSSFNKKRLSVSRKDYDKVKKETFKIIHRAMFQPPDWKDTPTLRGEEKKLAALIKVKRPSDYKSMEREAFENAEEDDEHDQFNESNEFTESHSSEPTLPLGAFVETRRSLILTHGVVIGDFIIGRRRKSVTLMSTGEVWFPGRTDVLFTFPNFTSVDLAERCGDDVHPMSPGQANARIEVLRRIREMERKSEIIHNVVSAKSRNIYQQVKSSDPDAWTTATLSTITHLISNRPDELTRFGLHKYIMANSLYFVADQSYETSRIIYIRPQSHVDSIKTIREWMRIPEGPIQSFAAKVKKITPQNQRIQDESRTELPSYAPATQVWTDTDRAILKFLHNSLRQTRTNQADPYSLGVSYILKQISPDKLVETSHLHQMLIDIGSLAPWQDLASLDPVVGLDTQPEPTSSWKQTQEAIAARGFTSMASAGTDTPLGPEDFHSTDPLESVRHDFGDLPVFVIDDIDAQELDDGISIERIPSEPDNLWIHVHVADPGSLIPRTHVLAKDASTRATTVYFTHRTWPLFPQNMMSHPTLGLSLGRKTDKSPLRVITFSGKIDNMGQLLDYKVRAGVIRNVNVITYEQADEAIGYRKNPPWYPFGHQLDRKSKPANLPDSYVKDLCDLKRLADCLGAKRYRDGIIIPARNMVSLIPVVRPPPEIFGPLYEPMTFRGFPTFEYSVSEASDSDAGARFVVAESMKLAARIASIFCTEHNLPVMRRVSTPLSLSGNLQDILDMRTSNCYIPMHLILDRIEVPSTSGYSMEPKAHYPLGVANGEGYTRVTSPLRRYIDLVVHWQIHHALLGSKASKTSPPFSSEQIWEITKTSSAHEKSAAIIERIHNRFWQIMFIKRWVQEPENANNPADPLNNLKAYSLGTVVLNSRKSVLQVQVYCPYLGILGMLENLPNPSIPIGSEVDVKIRELVLGTRPQIIFNLKR